MIGTDKHPNNDFVPNRDSEQAADPTSCRVTWAGVLHIELEDIPRLLEAINEIPSAHLVYQTKGIGLYHIVKG